MVDGQICQRCRVRPAVATVRRVQAGEPPQLERLCEVCLAEGRASASPAFRGGPFDEFFSALFGRMGPGAGAGIGTPVPQPVQQIDITQYFSDATREALQRAAQQAMEWGSTDIDGDHLLWSALHDEGVRRQLRRAGADAEALARQVEAGVDKGEPLDAPPPLSPDAKRALLAAFQQSRALRSSYIGPEHVLLALAADGDSPGARRLRRMGIPSEALREALQHASAAEGRGGGPPSGTPTLDQHGRDLTDLAREGELDPVIGRAEEIEQAIEVLSRRTKNNPVLIGEAGVGKTAIAEGIAQRIVAGEVPDTLRGKRLVNLDLAALLAGTRYRGEFEQRLKAVIDEIRAHSDELLLFIDEVHTLVGAGAAEGAMDAANMLKPALARGELHVIGATTLDEYRKNIEKDPALERRFQPITVDELSVPDTVQVLCGLKDRYEAFHRVRITDEAIAAAAKLSDRYIADRYLPDKAIDLIDQASARVRLRAGSSDARALEEQVHQLTREKDQAVAAEDYERAGALKATIEERRRELDAARDGHQRAAEVTAEEIATVVARATGIPVAQLTEAERDRLLRLEERLHERVVGQEEAVRVVAEAIRRNRAGLGDPDRPVGSFLFLGPTGVGKTELARTLADVLFGDEELMVRFDMSEFQERHTVSRLVGSPPGYVGYEEAGQLTEQVRRRPYAVLLLDEVEKAHPDVFNLLLQILDDGRLTDSQGRTVDFKNTVVIMTSNFGAERIVARPSVGFRAPSEAEIPFADVRDELMGLLRRNFRPEFLNRIDEIVVFRPLDRDQLLDVTRLLLAQLTDRLASRDIETVATEEAVALVAERGYDPEFGARPLRRTIQRLVENELSRLVLDGSLQPHDRVTIRVEDGALRFDLEKGGAQATGAQDAPSWEPPAEDTRAGTSGPSAPRP